MRAHEPDGAVDVPHRRRERVRVRPVGGRPHEPVVDRHDGDAQVVTQIGDDVGHREAGAGDPSTCIARTRRPAPVPTRRRDGARRGPAPATGPYATPRRSPGATGAAGRAPGAGSEIAATTASAGASTATTTAKHMPIDGRRPAGRAADVPLTPRLPTVHRRAAHDAVHARTAPDRPGCTSTSEPLRVHDQRASAVDRGPGSTSPATPNDVETSASAASNAPRAGVRVARTCGNSKGRRIASRSPSRTVLRTKTLGRADRLHRRRNFFGSMRARACRARQRSPPSLTDCSPNVRPGLAPTASRCFASRAERLRHASQTWGGGGTSMCGALQNAAMAAPPPREVASLSRDIRGQVTQPRGGDVSEGRRGRGSSGVRRSRASCSGRRRRRSARPRIGRSCVGRLRGRRRAARS